MPEQAVLNVDLADVWKERGRKQYIRTITWGDEITVVKQAATYLEVTITFFREKPDGSILPESVTGYIEPTRIFPASMLPMCITWRTTRS